MKTLIACLLFAALVLPVVADEIQTDWTFHAAGNKTRLTEQVPGETTPFFAHGTEPVMDSETVTLYLLTAHDFAGSMDEQVYVRWWDGTMAHWIMGGWVKSITLDASRPETRFRDQPTEGSVQLDLWKIDIPPWITQPGQNFYAIQLKGYSKEITEERYLLNRPGGDFSRTNNLGQIWSSSEEFDGQDWMVDVVP